MQTHEADLIQAGWKAYVRDGTEAGTVREVTADELTIQPAGEGTEPVKVPLNLVVEAHAGRVELDMGSESFGGSAGPASAAPTRDPGSPPEVITPEQMRRLTGG